MRKRMAALLALLTATAGLAVIGPTSPANAAASGLWKITCGFVGSAPDDPIVVPGKPGGSHMHDFFGNRSTNANSTAASMRGMASTCPQGDRAAYWTPSLYRNGKKINPADMIAYYTNSIAPGEERIEAFPAGFKMVTGDAKNTDSAKVSGHIEWGCLGNTQIGKAVPQTCASGGIQVRITFPSCWNGVTVDGNAIANMRFPSGGKCPAGFPRAFPTLRVNVGYGTGTDVGAITLASGSVASIHADFWNMWDQDKLQQLVRDCLQAKQQCAHFKGQTAGTTPAVTPSSTATTAVAMSHTDHSATPSVPSSSAATTSSATAPAARPTGSPSTTASASHPHHARSTAPRTAAAPRSPGRPWFLTSAGGAPTPVAGVLIAVLLLASAAATMLVRRRRQR